MSATRAQKRAATAKLEKLHKAAVTAADDLLVGLHEAVEAGVLSQASMAAAIGGVSPSVIRSRANKGAEIAKERESS